MNANAEINDTKFQKHVYKPQEQTINTAVQFYRCGLKINCCPTNNILFALFNNSNSCMHKNSANNYSSLR